MSDNGLYDIYTVVHTPWWEQTWFYRFLGVLAILVVVSLIYLLIKKWRAYRSRKPSWVRALDKLNALSRTYDAQQGKEFYINLIHILKSYLQERFEYDVMSKTDHEMLAHLRAGGFSQDLVDDLQTIIENSVMVKFAQHEVVQERIYSDLHIAKTIVQKTIPHDAKK